MQEFYDVGPMSAQEIKNAFVKCFASRDGRIVLSFLRKMTQEKYLGPDVSNEQMRHIEGQRYLFGYICSQCENK